MTVLHGTVGVHAAAEEHRRPVQVGLPRRAAEGAIVVMRASPPAVVVAKPPCECPVAPMWVVSMR